MPRSVLPIAAGAAAAYYLGPAGAGLTPFWAALGGGVTAAVVGQSLAAKPEQNFGQEAAGRLTTIRQAAAPWQWIYGQVRVGGVLTFAEVTPGNEQLLLVVTLAGHEVADVGQIWFDDQMVLDMTGVSSGTAGGSFAPNGQSFCSIFRSLGDEAAGVQPFPELVAYSAGKWTNAHCQSGRAKLYLRMAWNADVWSNGIPNITAVVKGRKVYDPRTGLTAWSDNAALCITDYLTNAALGLGCEYAAEINDAQTIAAANVCDELVTLASGGTEKRYTLNGAFRADSTPRQLLAQLNTAHGGYVRQLSGQWAVYPAVYATPEATALTQDDLRGALTIQPRITRRELCNGVKGVFVSPDNAWQASDYPAYQNATYVAEDQGEEIWRDVDRPFTTSGATAQRLAKIELERVRQQISVQWPGKLTCYRLQPGDVVPVTLAKYGWSSKPFEVLSVSLAIEPDEDGVVFGCDLVLRETAASVFNWNSGEEQAFDPAPDSNLPDPFTVAAPGTPSVSEELYASTGSAGVKSRAIVTWGAAADEFVSSGGFYELEYKLNADASWRRLAAVTSTSARIDDLAPGTYNFRVRSVNTLGVRSAYSAMTTRDLVGLTAPPSNVANFAVQSYAGQAKFTWDKPSSNSDLDVVIGGRTFVRWSPLTVGATWDHGSLVNPDGYPGDTSIGFGPLMTGTYMAKHMDSSGNFSATEASFVVTEALISALVTLATVTESPAFSGTKSNVVAIDGGIQLDGTTLIDSMLTNIDTWGAIDSLGGVRGSGSYTFASKLDLGSVKIARLFASISSLGFSSDDLIDSRTNNIDDWGLVDGDPIEDAEATLCVRTTNDDPNGASPAWSAYHRLGFVADYNARGFDFRLDFVTANATHNRTVTALSVSARQ